MITETLSFTEAIGPYLPLIGLIFSGALIGAFTVWNRRHGNKETKAPDVASMWAQQESDRRVRYEVEDMYWRLRRAFQGYFRRVLALILKLDLTPEQRAAFELTAKEQAAIDAKITED